MESEVHIVESPMIRELRAIAQSAPEKILLTENQQKVIKDKYLRDDPSPEHWLKNIAKNIALSELLQYEHFQTEIFRNVSHTIRSYRYEGLKDSKVFLIHDINANSDEKTENFKKWMNNLYALAENDPLASEIVKRVETLFYGMLARLDFLPNSPTLMNASRDLQQLSACYVLPIDDSIEGWMETAKNAAIIHKSGGGTGFAASRVRPRGDKVKSTKGIASGALSPFQIINAMTEVVKQGGTRRGANMGILAYNHPDIREFITCKRQKGFLENFNISVGIGKEFMQAVKENKEYPLINPRDGTVTKMENAKEIFDLMVKNAYETGDPGFVVMDRINESDSNPTPAVGQIESTNPCGEQPLLAYEPCNLGSINLSNFVIEDEYAAEIDYKRLGIIVKLATRFLDNVIDVNNYPIEKIEKIAKLNRRIGLGVMGWAEMLAKLRIPYNSEKSFKLAEEVMEFVDKKSLEASEQLAEERGVFPNFKDSIYDEKGRFFRGQIARPRNCARTTIAPTGTIAITAGLQGSGIEPFFAIVYARYNAAGLDNMRQGKKAEEKDAFYEVNSIFKEVAKQNNYFGMTEKELWTKVIDNHGSILGVKEIPEEIQKVFLTAHDLSPIDHVRIQCAFQKFTNNAVSKTVNFPNSATEDEVRQVYLLAYENGAKGVTIYRDGSKDIQVLNLTKKEEKKENKVETQAIEVTSAPVMNSMPKGDMYGVSSAYYEIATGNGTLHVHLNYDKDGPKKVFANITPIGTEISGLTTTIGILLSKYLEYGGDPIRILKHLNSIKGDKPIGFGNKRIDSIPHALAIALKDHLVKTGRMEDGQTKLKDLNLNLNKFSESAYCGKCFSANVAIISGCSKPTCFDCGHSECS